MTTTIGDLMTRNLVMLAKDAPATDAAGKMRDSAIGAVLVDDGSGTACGIVTDRDIVMRCVAEGKDPAKTPIGDLCTESPVHADVNDRPTDVTRLMRESAVRRVPVRDGGKTVGIVSLGDLALQQDRTSTLGEISAAPPGH